MSLSMRAVFLVLICFLFLTAACFAEAEVAAKKTEMERVLEQLRKNAEDRAALAQAQLSIPGDTGPRYLVKELRISGNNLVSTAELLERLPMLYAVTVQKDGKTVEEVYDFRAIYEIILDPGRPREVSLRSVQGLTKYFLSVYQKKGYAGIYVYVPAKAVEGEAKLVGEILPIQVLEGKVAEITVETFDFDRRETEEGFLKESLLKSWSPVKEGEVIHKKKLDDFVRLLNLNPDRYISAVISRSAEADALNLSYDVYESNPWHWYVQVDNAGTEDMRWAPRIGVINTNVTGMDDRFSAMYQAPWEKGIEDRYSLFGSYELPVLTPWLRLGLYGGHSEFDITPEGGPFNFIGRGTFFGGVLRYNVFQIDSWFVDVMGSLSHERSKVSPALGLTSDVNMDLWGVGVDLHRSDDMSNTSLTFNRVGSMGGSSKEEFGLARRDADPDFAIYTTSAAHSQYTDPNKVGRISGSFRWVTSDERLVPAKMAVFSGLYAVRGYKEYDIVADGGILASAQYEFDLVKHGQAGENRKTESEQAQEKKPWVRKVAPLAFIDYGRALRKSPVAGEWGVRELLSIGLGANVDLGDNFSAGIYYGWPLRTAEHTEQGHGQFSFSFIYRF